MKQDPWKTREGCEGCGCLALLVEEEQMLAQAEEDEPEFFPLNVILDSGAADHVVSRTEVPGHEVHPTRKSLAKVTYKGAGGEHILNEGEVKLDVKFPLGK